MALLFVQVAEHCVSIDTHCKYAAAIACECGCLLVVPVNRSTALYGHLHLL